MSALSLFPVSRAAHEREITAVHHFSLSLPPPAECTPRTEEFVDPADALPNFGWLRGTPYPSAPYLSLFPLAPREFRSMKTRVPNSQWKPRKSTPEHARSRSGPPG